MKANALLRSCVGKKPYSYKAALRRIADKQKEGVNLRWLSVRELPKNPSDET